MIEINIEQQAEETAFARAATEHFRDFPSHYTYADGDPEPGQMLAVRWNSFAIVVLRVSFDHPVLNYGSYQFIQSDFPKFTPSGD